MLEDFVVLGARVGVNNHVTIGEGAQIAATSIVHGDVPPGRAMGRNAGQARQAVVPRDEDAGATGRAPGADRAGTTTGSTDEG